MENKWFHLSEKGDQRPEINLSQNDQEQDQIICTGYVPVVLEKVFGPLIFASIRIFPDADTCEWIIQRKTINTGEWVEVAKIPGQIEGEFDQDMFED